MAAIPVLMPKLGMTMEEGIVVAWHVAAGGRVARGAPLLVIESEKTEAEIEATASGVLRHVYVPAGAKAPCGALLAALTTSADESFEAAAFAREHGGEAAGRAPRPGRPVSAAMVSPPPAGAGALQPAAARRPVAPAARALARELGIELAGVIGSGPGGRVVRQDVAVLAARREALAEVAPGVRLEVLREGEGTPVLLLPGFGTDVSSLALPARALVSRHRVLAVNPRGVGLSDAPEEDAYRVEQAAADAAALLGEPAHVVGASLGAAVALELALTHPGRVRSLALLTPFVEAGPRLLAVLEAWCAIAEASAAATLAHALLPWLFSEATLADAAARARTLRGLEAALARVPAATLRRQAAGIAAWSGRRVAALGRLRVPTLVLAGAADLLTAEAPAVGEAIAGARTHVVSGAGHALAVEAGAAVGEILLEHVGRRA
jgi:pimeloyl-ACP methyl ester carboxylesterase